ncbi:tetratricopeptide repeat-containing sulfotransferase family protein [Bradyrhizobium tropiciagri]|uniref:tetratricopeptide repeat-containing sulfotransferase family protein n=1 Tax=Bradyrhizobium tropiciagri TaxID=312253 RepID=UPI00067D3856|nr:tetratricopeptide repeat-containing sulfotransferase family protein [Bradyrhizobium tropiciagri]
MNDELAMWIGEAPATAPSSSDIQALLRDAIGAYTDGRGDDAERRAREILVQQPDHLAGLQILTAVAGQTGRLPLALRIARHAVSLHPNHVSAHVQLANLLREDGDLAGAANELDLALQLQPDNAGAHNDRGLVLLAESQFERAVDCFAEALRIDPSCGLTHYNMALALEALGSLPAAMERYQEAARLRPNLVEAHYKLGLLLEEEGYRKRAIQCLRAAAALRQGTAFALLCEARILGFEGDDLASEELVRRAIVLEPRKSDAHAMLGTVLMQQGRFDEASASFDLANALNTHDVLGPVGLVEVKRLTDADRPLIGQLERKLGNPAITGHEAALVHFALGKAYDDIGEYGHAIGHFDQANSLKKRVKSKYYDAAAHAELVDRLIRRFTPQFFDRNKDAAHAWDVPVLIVGMPRSGTTLVEQVLSSHPDVTAGGELAFWPDHAPEFGVDREGRIDPAWIRETQAAYQTRLKQISPMARRITDKLPQNFHNIGLLYATFPRARVIHCRRDPIDTCLSVYFNNFANGMDFSFDRQWIVDYYRQYARLTEHWRNVLPPGFLLEISYEDVVAAPEPFIRRIIEFCGLQWDDACLRPEQNQRVIKTASVWQARQPIYRTSVSRWQRYEPWLGVFNSLPRQANLTMGAS